MPTGTGHGAESGDVASEVGRTIRARMGYHRVSMVELGRRTGIPRSTLANQIDSGRITVDNLIAIGNALGVAPAELLPDSTFKAQRVTAGIPDPGGSGVVAVLAAADAAATFTQRYLLGDRDGAVIEAADAALDVDDWATDTWWLNQPAGESS